MVTHRDAASSDEKVMESQTIRRGFPHAWNLLVTGGVDNADYELEGEMRLLKSLYQNGFAFRYQTGRSFYAFVFEDGHVKAVKKNLFSDIAETLSSTPFEYETFVFYRFKINCFDNTFTLSINGNFVTSFKDDEYTYGKIALIGNSPTQFANIKLSIIRANLCKSVFIRVHPCPIFNP
jgi:hypothetical protein